MAGEYEPKDSRNVTGTASTPDGRWTAQGQQPPLANGQPPEPGRSGQPMQQGGTGGQQGGMSGSDDARDGQPQQFDQSGGQMAGGGMGSDGDLAGQIREHMSVIDAEGTQVGTVDGVENDQIKLTRSGSSDGQHHYLPIDRVVGIEGDTIRLHDSGDSVFGSNGS